MRTRTHKPPSHNYTSRPFFSKGSEGRESAPFFSVQNSSPLAMVQPKREADDQQELEEGQMLGQDTELERAQYSAGEAPLPPADSNPGSEIQTKLAIGQPNDQYEQEADHIADQTMRMPEPSLQHQVEPQERELSSSPPQHTPPTCTLPVRLGSARRCGSGTDFTHFDFPSISSASSVKLAAWAAALYGRPFRSLVTDRECELEMDGVLVGLAGSEGHAAFSRFAAGTGGTVTHGSSSTLGSMALVSRSFRTTVARVKASIEAQLAAQATSGVLNPCALSVTPPPTSFEFSDGVALKAVIGGTQGEQLFATGFTSDLALRTYTIELRFIICDDFGVDEDDLYFPGLCPFWVLQHERSATKYAPFINELDLPVTVSGRF